MTSIHRFETMQIGVLWPISPFILLEASENESQNSGNIGALTYSDC